MSRVASPTSSPTWASAASLRSPSTRGTRWRSACRIARWRCCNGRSTCSSSATIRSAASSRLPAWRSSRRGIGIADRLTTMLGATERAWGALRRRFLYSSALPEWSQLTLYARTLSPVIQSTLPPPQSPWRPWTLRVVACLAQSSVLQVGGVSADAFQRWLAGAFGSPLPPDVTYLVDGDADFAEAAAKATAEVAAGPAAGGCLPRHRVTAPGDSATPGPQPSVARRRRRPAGRGRATCGCRRRISPTAVVSQKTGPTTGDLVTLRTRSPRGSTRVPWKTLGLSALGLSVLALLVLGAFLSVFRMSAPLLDPMPGNLPGGGQSGAPVVPGAKVAIFRVLDWLRSLREFGFWIVAAAGLLLVGARDRGARLGVDKTDLRAKPRWPSARARARPSGRGRW